MTKRSYQYIKFLEEEILAMKAPGKTRKKRLRLLATKLVFAIFPIYSPNSWILIDICTVR